MRLILLVLCVGLWLSASAQIQYTTIKSGLGTITDITHAGDGSQRIFVANKTGTISILSDSYSTLGVLLSLPSGMISTASEKGLLGLAFHPDFKTNGYFFVNYNPAGTNYTRISRFTAADPASNNTVSLATEKIILTITGAANTNHKAGDLAFGPDGYLYFGTGDGGGGGDPQGSGQNGNSLLAKILRIDINTTSPYAIPSSNPFVSNPAILDEIWDIGLRNPWRISFDRQTGDLWIGDVGQNAREEIDFEPAGTGGKNYGWNCREGFSSYNGCAMSPSFSEPIFDYGRCNDPCSTPGLGRSVTGGFVYRGTKASNASMLGYYIFADYLSRHGWLIKNNSGSASGLRQALEVITVNKLTTTGGITSFGELENGEIMAGLDNGELGTINATAALPIRMLSFQGVKERDQVVLSWTTVSEINTLQYDIERSGDGLHFDKIGKFYYVSVPIGIKYNPKWGIELEAGAVNNFFVKYTDDEMQFFYNVKEYTFIPYWGLSYTFFDMLELGYVKHIYLSKFADYSNWWEQTHGIEPSIFFKYNVWYVYASFKIRLSKRDE